MKKIVSIILVLPVLFGMITALAAGTQSDPLITQVYIENTYRNALSIFINDEISKDPMNRIRMDSINESIGFDFVSRATEISFQLRDEVVLLPGSSFTLKRGSATIIFNNTALIDVTTGNPVNSGTALQTNHRYFCAEGTSATVLASAASSGYIDGYYKIEPSQITMFVERLYNVVLGRPSDAEGLKGWVEAIIAGDISGADVARGFVFSEELTRKNLSNDDFVEMLYRAMLNRNSEPAGKAGWVNGLNSGMSRQEVFQGFVNSVEFNRLCSDYGLIPTEDSPLPMGIRVFVNRLYLECLGRQPDLLGRDGWMRALHNRTRTGSQVAHGFVFSPELNSRNLSNEDFVEVLYRTMLGRNSEPAGKAGWVNGLYAGMTRQQVFEGFVASREFTEICRTLGVRR